VRIVPAPKDATDHTAEPEPRGRADPPRPQTGRANDPLAFCDVLAHSNHASSSTVTNSMQLLIESAKLAGVEPDGYLRTAARHAIRGERIPLPHELATA
jgi:hypothetical protein